MRRTSTIGRNNDRTPITIYVDDDFVDDPPNHKWDTIQEGIDDAFNGDTIIVRDGIYNENLNVYKRLTIQSENGADATIVQTASVYDHVFYVIADYVNITGFTTSGAEYSSAGIYLYGAAHCNVSYNTASDNNYGILLYDSSNNNTITSNTASDNNYGIYLAYPSNNMLKDNNASNNGVGIYLYGSSNNMLTSNTASDNNYGIYLGYSSNNNILQNSTANTNNLYGIYLQSSSNNTIYHNNLINNTNSNACDDGNNTWDDDYPSGGNYYSDYDGTDNNTDGIGDTPHPIPGGSSVDYFPLMQPWNEDTQQKGDLNGDGQITAADAIIALGMAVSGEHNDNADMDGDGRVSSVDALIILQVAAGAIEL